MSRKQIQPQQISNQPTISQQARQVLQEKLKPSHSIPMGGRLAHFHQNWTQITDNEWILQAIKGHQLEFHRIPPVSTQCYQRELNPDQTVALGKEVQDLLEKEAIERISDPGGFYSPLFVVPKKDGGWHPIINLKQLNHFLDTTHFKMETILSLRDILKNNYMIKVDLKDAYLTVSIHTSHRKYLRFSWNGSNYQFKMLPFGLSIAPRTFMKIMRPVMAKLQEQGLRLIIYLDDILLVANSPEKLRHHTRILIDHLQDLGFILNTKKCVLEPCQLIEFLGFLIDSRMMKLLLPQEKINKIKKECQAMLRKAHSSARHLAHLIRLLTVSNPAYLPAPLHYRGLQRLKHKALSKFQSYD